MIHFGILRGNPPRVFHAPHSSLISTVVGGWGARRATPKWYNETGWICSFSHPSRRFSQFTLRIFWISEKAGQRRRSNGIELFLTCKWYTPHRAPRMALHLPSSLPLSSIIQGVWNYSIKEAHTLCFPPGSGRVAVGCGKSKEPGTEGGGSRPASALIQSTAESVDAVPCGSYKSPKCRFHMRFQVAGSYQTNWNRILSLHTRSFHCDLGNWKLIKTQCSGWKMTVPGEHGVFKDAVWPCPVTKLTLMEEYSLSLVTGTVYDASIVMRHLVEKLS